MNVAVFGANGYVGQHMVWYLVEKMGHTVTGLDLQENFAGRHSIAYHQADIRSYERLAELDMDYDVVYFFSGITGTEVAFDRYKDFLDINELGLLHLLNRLRHSEHKPKVIFPSTRLVYKGVEGAELDEEAEKEFKTIYASTKYNGELYLQMYKNVYGIDYSVFRVSVPYGNELSTHRSYGTLSFFIEQSLQGKPITLYGDGGLRRTFTHIADVCRQMILVGERPESSGQCYNVDGEPYSLRDIAEVVVAKYGGSIEYVGWPGNSAALESGHTVFNCSKIRSLLPDSLTTTLKDWVHT